MSDPPDQSRQGPHDALFRHIFGQPVHAASHLRAILPAALITRLDLDTLVPVPTSFVDPELRWRHCDLLLRTRLDHHDTLI
ncbi:MAG: Rpn family recombination-promoting nuclease/putative transposase [Pseudonocardia sp.]|nr:Rpn family recombination-promoting nuclease/putative transposase [Pseudonocardia sp.]